MSFKVIGYLPAWHDWTHIEDITPLVTHYNLSFALIEDHKIVIGKFIQEEHLQKINDLKAKFPHLKVNIAVGGWGGDGFSDASLTEENRTTFSRSVVAFIEQYGLDGVDIDWEFPVQGGGGIVCRPEDKENFTLFMKSLREHLDEAEKKNNRSYELTFASNTQDWYFCDSIETVEVMEYVDYINFMSYDFCGEWSPRTGHHAGLYEAGLEEIQPNGVKRRVQALMDMGVAGEKIVLGVPFYGYFWSDVKGDNNGLYQPCSGERGFLTYDNLKASYLDNKDYRECWDETAFAPYLWNESKKTFVSYENVKTLAAKREFALEQKLGGLMVWEVTQNKDGELLKVLGNGQK